MTGALRERRGAFCTYKKRRNFTVSTDIPLRSWSVCVCVCVHRGRGAKGRRQCDPVPTYRSQHTYVLLGRALGSHVSQMESVAGIYVTDDIKGVKIPAEHRARAGE